MTLLDQVKPLIDSHEIISFDIFDTLLLRPYVKPTDLFFHLEKINNIEGYAKARIEAEKKARHESRFQEDITLNDIYDQISSKYKPFKEKEMLFEKKVLTVNPLMKEVYDYAISLNKRIIIVSDMYLPDNFLVNVLNEKGYNNFEKIYVSSRYKHLKYSGNLFKDVLNDLSVPPTSILHIGDNAYNDGKVPHSLGISTFTFEKNIDIYLKQHPHLTKLHEKFSDNIGISIIIGLSAIYALEKRDYWADFGYSVAGPICLSYVNWLNNEILNNHIKDVIFIARDGFILQKIFQLYQQNINTHYIYAPRSLNLICQLNYQKDGPFTFEHIKTILNFYRFKDEQLKYMPEAKNKKEAQQILDDNIKTIERLAVIEQEKYKSYIETQNLEINIATVDSVSMFFSAQKFFEKLFPQKHFNGYYYLIQQGADTVNNQVSSYRKITPYSDDMKLVEFIMTAPEPPIEYINNGLPQYKEISENEQKRIDACRIFSDTAVKFAETVKRYFGNLDLYLTAEDIKTFMEYFIEYPNTKAKDAFSEVLFAYDPEHRKYIHIFKNWSTPDRKKETIHKSIIYTFRFFKFPIAAIKKGTEILELRMCNIPVISLLNRRK